MDIVSYGVKRAVPDEIRFGFDCSDAAVFPRTTLHQSASFRIEKIQGANAKTFTTFAEIPDGHGAMILTEQGTVLSRSETSSRWHLMPPTGVALTRGPRRTILRVARGQHVNYLITWELAGTALFAAALENRMREFSELGNGAGLPFRSIVPHFETATRRFRRVLDPAHQQVAVPLMLSVLSEGLAFLGDGIRGSVLAPTPRTVPEPLQLLIESVRREPDRPWPLKDAADEAGYSPFHFSRIFKQQTGFGFHEFVDRTRTEHAVELLCSTDDAVDAVAMEAGFGTTQGLRESVKEYLGLVPTELRTEPDENLIS